MNLVAHQYLSFENPQIQIGNLLGEGVKGTDLSAYNYTLQTGILLHREIDTFTDNHEIVKQSTSLFHPTQGKYAPVLIDVLYDYILIKNWHLFNDEYFDVFVRKCYDLFQQNQSVFPESLKKIVGYILQYDWFTNYSTLEGVAQTLTGLSKRAKFPNNLNQALEPIQENLEAVEKHFFVFFPDLVSFCKSFILKRDSAVKQ